MQRQVMKDAGYPGVLELRDYPLPFLEGGEEQVIHVVGLLAVVRHDRRSDLMTACPWPQSAMVELPNLLAPLLDLRPNLELFIFEGCDHIREQIAGADVHP